MFSVLFVMRTRGFLHHGLWSRPKACQTYGWLLNSSWDQSNLHQGKNGRETMDFEVPKRHILSMHYPLTWSDGYCGGRGKIGALVERGRDSWQKTFVIINFNPIYLGKKRWRKDNGQSIYIYICNLYIYFISQNCHFWAHKKSSHSFFGA